MDKHHCECTDPGCPVHPDRSACKLLARQRVYRNDTIDLGGLALCTRCAKDAFDSGLFYSAGTRKRNIAIIRQGLRGSGKEAIEELRRMAREEGR